MDAGYNHTKERIRLGELQSTDPRGNGQMTTLEELDAAIAAPLHPDLEPWVVTVERLGRCLKHPLVFEVPLHTPGYANKMYEHKQAQLAEAIKARNWEHAIWLYERPYRMTILISWRNTVKPEDLPRLVTAVWQDCEYPKQFGYQNVVRLFRRVGYCTDGPPQPSQVITVWRGVQQSTDRRGMSWTEDLERAKWFARRFGQNGSAGHVYEAVVKPSMILARFEGRGEQEVVVDPKGPRDVRELK